MKAPFHPRIKDPTKAYTVNEDPTLLNAMYTKLLGRGGENALSDEVKWLAVTHKSFDQGRRGFNDRLAFLGKPCPVPMDGSGWRAHMRLRSEDEAGYERRWDGNRKLRVNPSE